MVERKIEMIKKGYIYAIRIRRRFYEDDCDPTAVTSFDLKIPHYGNGFAERAYLTLDAANADFDKLLKKIDFCDPVTNTWRKINKKTDRVIECKPALSRHVRAIDVYVPFGCDDTKEVSVLSLYITKVDII